MADRSSLGVADVPDATLAAMVADLLGRASVELRHVTIDPVAYDVPSITTVGRHWVSGTARTPSGEEPFRIFVKHVQAWHRSPFFRHVPEGLEEIAATGYPWRIEAAVYASDVAARLPAGVSMPRCLGVFWLPEDAVVVWLEAVDHEEPVWDPARFEHVARLLGRVSGSPGLNSLGDVGRFPWRTIDYVHGRLRGQVLPAVLSDEPWTSPTVREAFGDALRDRMRAACAQVEAFAEELDALPRLVSHGDAAPGNLLPGPDDGVVMVDFGFWMPKSVGFDLGQLVGGEVQLGRLPAVPLEELDERCVAAYVRGLADEGVELDVDVVRRAHALQLFLFLGASALPDEGMSLQTARARAALARLSLDLLDRTG